MQTHTHAQDTKAVYAMKKMAKNKIKKGKSDWLVIAEKEVGNNPARFATRHAASACYCEAGVPCAMIVGSRHSVQM